MSIASYAKPNILSCLSRAGIKTTASENYDDFTGG